MDAEGRLVHRVEDAAHYYRADSTLGPYGADILPNGGHFFGPWRPSIHMPRRASRLTLEIAEIRVQRLQDLTPEDAQAEGIQVARCGCEVCSHTSAICPADGGAYIEAFAALWDSINGKRAPWGANPWVWALTFRRVDVPSQAKST